MYHIRTATADDAALLSHLGRETFCETFEHLYLLEDLEEFLSKNYTESAQSAEIADPNTIVWIAEKEHKAVGYLVAGQCKLPVEDMEPGALEIRRLYILASAQGTGLAQELMAKAMEWASDLKAPEVYLGVWENNFKAQRFYARFGFTRCGTYFFPVGSQRDREFILRAEPPFQAKPLAVSKTLNALER